MMPPRQLALLAENLKALRKTAGLSQQALAVKAELSVSVVSQLEQGSKKDPRLSTLTALADALGIGVGQLVSELAAEGPPKEKKKPKKK